MNPEQRAAIIDSEERYLFRAVSFNLGRKLRELFEESVPSEVWQAWVEKALIEVRIKDGFYGALYRVSEKTETATVAATLKSLNQIATPPKEQAL